jgi:hypothetical protein
MAVAAQQRLQRRMLFASDGSAERLVVPPAAAPKGESEPSRIPDFVN